MWFSLRARDRWADCRFEAIRNARLSSTIGSS